MGRELLQVSGSQPIIDGGHGDQELEGMTARLFEYSGESVPPIPDDSVPLIPDEYVPPIPEQSVPPFSCQICC